MEIDFLIQWKNKVTDKTDLTSKVKEMLTQLFRDVKSNKFYFDSDDGNSYKLDYKNLFYISNHFFRKSFIHPISSKCFYSNKIHQFS